MLDAAQVLGGFSALLLVLSVAAWLMMGRTQLLRRIGGRVELHSAQGQIAAKLLVAAVTLSVAAAMLALVERILG